MDAPIRMRWDFAPLPATLAWCGLIGVGLFVSGSVLSLLRPSSSDQVVRQPTEAETPSTAASSMQPLFRDQSTLVDGNSKPGRIKPIFFDQQQAILELKLSGSPAQWPALIDQFLDEAAIRLIGLGEQDIRFERPGIRQGVGSLSFNGFLGERWMLYVHLVATDTSGQAMFNVPLVFWLAEPVEYQAHFKQPAQADFERLWSKVQEQIRMPLMDAASELPDIDIVFPQRSTPGP